MECSAHSGRFGVPEPGSLRSRPKRIIRCLGHRSLDTSAKPPIYPRWGSLVRLVLSAFTGSDIVGMWPDDPGRALVALAEAIKFDKDAVRTSRGWRYTPGSFWVDENGREPGNPPVGSKWYRYVCKR